MSIFDKSDKEAIEHIEKVTGTKFSDEQRDILSNRGGMCILASAGSGKTTTLINLIAKRILTGEIADTSKLLCTTYSRAGASEMDTRLKELLSKLGIQTNFSIKTMHAVYYQLLLTFGYSIDLVSNGERRMIIKGAILDTLDIPKSALSEDTIDTVDSILSFQINNLMSDEAIYNSYVFTLRNDISLEQYTKIRTKFTAEKDARGKKDFDDLQLLMYTIMVNPNYAEAAKKYCRSIFRYIYVDEAQDMSKIQFKILQLMVENPDNLIVIGDDDQAIYQWRGADPSIILNVCAIYPELTRKTLTTNYRCLSSIVEKADHGIHFNTNRSDKTMKPSKMGGEIRFCQCGSSNLYEMSKYPYVYIKELINNGVSPKDIAVLCRNNSHAIILGNMLFKDGIFCKALDGMKLTSNFHFKGLTNIFKLGENTTNSNIVSSSLWLLVPYLKNATAKEIGKIQSTYGLTFKDTLGLVLKRYLNVNIDWENNNIKTGILDSTHYSEVFRGMREETVDNLYGIYSILCSPTVEDTIIGFMKLYYNNNRKSNNPEIDRTIEGIISYCGALIKTMGYSNFSQYIRTTAQYEEGHMAVINNQITLSTVHSAKGKEWKYVIIFADDNVAFPSFRDIANNKKSEVPDKDIIGMIDEGRRLHYVAFTRAKEHLTIFSDSKNCSIYALETMGVADRFNITDYDIINMAKEMRLRDDLVAAGYAELFSENSAYKLDIDVSGVNSNVSIQYGFASEANVDRDLNIYSLQTGKAANSGEDEPDF